MNNIPLIKNTIKNSEIDSLIEWLKNYPRLTQGPIVKEFETQWSAFLGLKYSSFVNSGSSALLLAYYALIIKGLKSNLVVVPGLSWATDLSPVLQFGLKPILCDCNMDDLSLDLDHLEEILKNNNISIVNVVSVLGLVPDMDRLMSLKEKYGFYLIEDVCESFGSKYKNKYLGLFGDISVFSLYYGHHLSTIEGGMVCCENPEIDQILKMIREHGWDRGLTEDQKAKIRADHNTQNFSAPYTFYYPGFNVRGTDLQAFLGLSQLENAKTVIEKRNENFLRYLKRLNLEWKPKNTEDSYISNFCYPIISKNRNAIIDSLSQSGTETRPLICGTMGRQPFYSKIYGEMTLPNCDLVDKFGLYIPNNSDLSEEELNIIINAVNESKDS